MLDAEFDYKAKAAASSCSKLVELVWDAAEHQVQIYCVVILSALLYSAWLYGKIFSPWLSSIQVGTKISAQQAQAGLKFQPQDWAQPWVENFTI